MRLPTILAGLFLLAALVPAMAGEAGTPSSEAAQAQRRLEQAHERLAESCRRARVAPWAEAAPAIAARCAALGRRLTQAAEHADAADPQALRAEARELSSALMRTRELVARLAAFADQLPAAQASPEAAAYLAHLDARLDEGLRALAAGAVPPQADAAVNLVHERLLVLVEMAELRARVVEPDDALLATEQALCAEVAAACAAIAARLDAAAAPPVEGDALQRDHRALDAARRALRGWRDLLVIARDRARMLGEHPGVVDCAGWAGYVEAGGKEADALHQGIALVEAGGDGDGREARARRVAIQEERDRWSVERRRRGEAVHAALELRVRHRRAEVRIAELPEGSRAPWQERFAALIAEQAAAEARQAAALAAGLPRDALSAAGELTVVALRFEHLSASVEEEEELLAGEAAWRAQQQAPALAETLAAYRATRSALSAARAAAQAAAQERERLEQQMRLVEFDRDEAERTSEDLEDVADQAQERLEDVAQRLEEAVEALGAAPRGAPDF